MSDDFFDDITPLSNWVKFDNPGDSLKGQITQRAKGTDFHGAPCATFVVRTADGEEVSFSASQYELKRKVAELKPNVGDVIAVTFTNLERIDGGRDLKRFNVRLKRAGSETVEGDEAVAEAAPAPAPAQAAPASAADL